MGLSWDHEGARQLVAQLSPPWPAAEAERALRRVYRGFATEMYRERQGDQKNDQVRQELEALDRALDGLCPRAMNMLCDALDDRLFLPFPYEQAQAIINPCRDDVPVTRLEPRVRLYALGKAVEKVLGDIRKELRSGRKGVVSAATYKALHVLCLVYCRVHAAPYPTWDFHAETTRNREALEFALACLQEWYTPGIEGLWADDLARGLNHYRRKNQG